MSELKNGLIIKDGIEKWYLNDRLHRVDGPAVLHPDGSYTWYLNGKRHRPESQDDGDAGPALYENGDKKWYQNGKLHRLEINGPAIERSNGDKEWYHNGLLHRFLNDSPAIERANGDKEWYQNGLLHRSLNDEPAIERSNGDKCWYQHGNRHRLEINGPAAILANGTIKFFYLNGNPHRYGGPAVLYTCKKSCWYQNGRLYKSDGTYIEYIRTSRFNSRYTIPDNEWYICGYKFTEHIHIKFLKAFHQAVKSYRFTKWIKSKAFCEYYYRPDQIGGILAKCAIKNALNT